MKTLGLFLIRIKDVCTEISTYEMVANAVKTVLGSGSSTWKFMQILTQSTIK